MVPSTMKTFLIPIFLQVFYLNGNCQWLPPQGPMWPSQEQAQGPVQTQGPAQQTDWTNLFRNYFNVFTMPWHSWDQSTPVPSNFEAYSQMYANNLTSIASKCPPTANFLSFNPAHQSAVRELIDLFKGRDLDSMLEFGSFCKSRPEIHPKLWYAAFIKSQQLSPSPQTLQIRRPSIVELFPSDYIPNLIQPQQQHNTQPVSHPQSVQHPQQMFYAQPNWPSRFRRQFRQFQAPSFPQRPGPFGSMNQWFQPWSQPAFTQPQTQPAAPQPQAQQQCIRIDETIGQDNGPDNALWYFREDIQLNGHHSIWHILYPYVSNQAIPRRGEQFYFFHHDLLGRYSAERLANGLPTTVPVQLEWNAILAEGYNPHLTDTISTQAWVPRASNTQLNGNTLNNDIVSRLGNRTIYLQRIVEMLNTGNIVVNGRSYSLRDADNINLIGETFEASTFSANPAYYGQVGIHNDAHWIIANVLNSNFPPGSFGVLGHSATAMRDIAFYRIHQSIDNLFHTLKTNLLPPYSYTSGTNSLVFSGVRVTGIAAQSTAQGASANNLRTFWSIKNLSLQGGLDFNPNNVNNAPTTSVCAKHLNHDEFTYQIQVQNNRQGATNAFVRIFMAPRYKSLSTQERYTYEEQRRLFFIMDSFIQSLQPGTNVITRNSVDSTLTVPWPSSISEIRTDLQNGVNREVVNCECGFPHHLLLPKGTEQGMVFDLFVMLTNADEDYVSQSGSQTQFGQCIPSYIHCGILGQQYPDSKPLGYPFDRVAPTTPLQTVDANGNPAVQNAYPQRLEDYLAPAPNMGAVQVTITHNNVIVPSTN